VYPVLGQEMCSAPSNTRILPLSSPETIFWSPETANQA
jgi:hypothetical protein